MTVVAIVSKDPFLSAWDKRMSELVQVFEEKRTAMWVEAESYLIDNKKMPDGYSKKWNASVKDDLFEVYSPEEQCEQCGESHELHVQHDGEVFGLELPKNIGDSLLSLLRKGKPQ